MTDLTPKVVRQRIMDIAQQSTFVTAVFAPTSNDDQCKFSDADLPALVVAVRGTTGFTATSRESALETRQYDCLFLVERLCNDSELEQQQVLDHVWQVINQLPDFFWRSAKRLELRDVNNLPRPLTGVRDTERMLDDAPQFIPWADEVYGGVLYHLPVITQRA